MNESLLLQNLWAVGLQTAIVIALGSLAPWLIKARKPDVLYRYWRFLLLGCLLLPLLESTRVVQSVAGPEAQLSTLPPIVATPTQAISDRAGSFVSVPHLVFLLVAVGVLARGTWLLVGFLRLRGYRANSQPWTELPPDIRRLWLQLAPAATRIVTSDVQGPVTFGWLKPVIVFPSGFPALDPSLQAPIACHEFVHLKRRDWVWQVVEELLLVFCWFHPGFWWVVSRIRVTREQVVDQEVVTLMRDKKQYVQSLLTAAATPVEARPIPATLLLAENRLADRIGLILKEVSMKPARLCVFLALAFILIGSGGFFAVRAFPLLSQETVVLDQGSPAVNQLSRGEMMTSKPVVRVGSRVQDTKVVHRVQPAYPASPELAGVDGYVVIQVLVSEQGDVLKADALEGHPLLREAAVAAVRQWRYSPTLLNGEAVPVETSVFWDFSPQTGATRVFARIDSNGELQMDGQLQGNELAKSVQQAVSVELTIDRTVPFRVAERAVTNLQAMGARKIRARSQYIVQSGKLYCPVTGVPGTTPPEIDLEDLEPQSGSAAQKKAVFRLFLDEAGRMMDVVQLSGDPASEMRIELLKRRANRPATLDGSPVPCTLMIVTR